MASLQEVIEQLALLTTAGQNTTIDGTVTNTTFTSSGPFGLIISLLSTKALRDWAILLAIGSVFEIGRRWLSSWWGWLIDSFVITAVFDQDDPSYQWIQLWLSKHPSWKKARNVEVSTSDFGLDTPAEEISDEQRTKVSYIPAISQTYSLWHKYRWMQVTRETESTRGGWAQRVTLTFRIFTRDHNILTEMIQAAKEDYEKAQEDSISIYSSRIAGDSWRQIATRPKRPLSSIILNPGVVDLVLGDARDFLESKQWYADRGIPFRRGYLLYGTPGAGKTSLIHSIAGELGLDVYIVSLSRSGLDDTGLIELISELPERCIALMEDIDAAFHHGVNREIPGPAQAPEGDKSDEEQGRSGPSTSGAGISLSGLLNALDGIAAQEGRILFATTNKYNALDPALCRPGRLDLHIEFTHASQHQAEALFRRFYEPPSSELSAETETVKTSKIELEKNESESGDSGFEDAPAKDLIELSSESSIPPSSSVSVVSEKAEEERHEPVRRAPTFTGISHRIRAPQLSREEITELGSRFAASVPERQLSMASLQGFLMVYKTRPYEAVARISAWVEDLKEIGA